ncbi:MAG: BACON domain-containing protein [Bacteroidaceae bacterium]|nr:BACON domain-containing protein [Bacteroidaceae bacterium]
MRIRAFLYILSILLVLTACEDVNNFGIGYQPALTGHYIQINSDQIVLEASQKRSQTIEVKAVASPWEFRGMDSWLTVNPSSSNQNEKVEVAAKENLSGEVVRSCILLLESTDPTYDYKRNISVTQQAATPYLNVSESTLAVSASSANIDVSISANIDWHVSTSAQWLTVTSSSDGITIKVQENTETSARSATIRIEGALSKTITVTQAIPSQPISNERSLDFDNAGGSYQLSITSEVAWKAETSASWLHLSPDNGEAGQTTMTVEALPNSSLNDRSGFVFLKIGEQEALSITVNQKGISLTISPETLSFKADESSQTIQVQSNTTWSVLSKPDWLTIFETNGSGTCQLMLTCSDNWGTTARNGILKIGREGTELVKQVTVTQEGRNFSELISSLTFDATASSQTVTITTDGQWKATVSENWITTSPSSGTGKATMTINVTENTKENERNGVIDVTVGDITQHIAVTQRGKYFTIDPNTFAELPSKGGTHVLHIETNERWTASSTSNWIQLSAANGFGNIDVSITAPDNPSIHGRKDTTSFIPTYLQPIRIITSQAARYLKVDATEFYFFAKGGVSEPVTVNTDASYTVGTTDSWLTIHQDNNTFTVSASKNETEIERRGQVIVKMTGLKEGEDFQIILPVIQRDCDSKLNVDSFGTDQLWDIVITNATISIIGFSEDQNWQ